MKIYLASRWVNREALRPVRDLLQKHGHEVTSRWLDVEGPDKQEQALMDLQDIDRADALVLWPDNVPQPERPYGGMYFEFGYAWAKHKLCYVVFPETTTSIFVDLPYVRKCNGWYSLLDLLKVALAKADEKPFND